eukprot:GSMAST32.ASY1.ANO1.20.1 assembled CDS
MSKFLRLAMTEPDICRVPMMIDSSKFEIIEEGLKWVQGKCSFLKLNFKRQAKIVKRHGAAVIVMAFDEDGQAATYADKVRICKRSYDIKFLGMAPEDIIFDPNILTIATGLPEHNGYVLFFFNFEFFFSEIKRICPFCKISGGVSNLSFGFRGVNVIREAMHSVFLYHAIQAGMDMVYEDIEPELRSLVENVILNRNQGNDLTNGERLIANSLKSGSSVQVEVAAWRSKTIEERLTHSCIFYFFFKFVFFSYEI